MHKNKWTCMYSLLSWVSMRCPRGGRENMQDWSGHQHAHSCPVHLHEVEGEGECTHRTGVGTYMLTPVLGIHEMSKGRKRECTGPEWAPMCSLVSWASVRCPRRGRECTGPEWAPMYSLTPCAAHDMSEHSCALSCHRWRLV